MTDAQEALVERVALAIAGVIAGGKGHQPEDWLNDKRREEAQAAMDAIQPELDALRAELAAVKAKGDALVKALRDTIKASEIAFPGLGNFPALEKNRAALASWEAPNG